MRWLLCGFVVFWIVSLIDIIDTTRYSPNGACLVKNKYKHERSCSGPRRKFYVFHRIILNCVSVFTKCKRFHKHNEWPSLKKCQYECGWHMKIHLPKNGTNSTNTTNQSSTAGTTAAGAAGGEGAAGGGQGAPGGGDGAPGGGDGAPGGGDGPPGGGNGGPGGGGGEGGGEAEAANAENAAE
ncbi:POU domain, class 4, transcription factor 1 [Drosophila montana]|uniref:POU domain, class 4, transcription factor 1 n=1 Tax=Drosophila montana TaxID=40370 RepID=UPI00313ADE94